MAEILTIVYLVYMFIALYFLSLFTLTFLQNRREIFSVPRTDKEYSLSIVVPCFNEEASIEETVKSILDSDYNNLEKVFVVDDCSTDNSYRIIKELEKKYDKVVALQTPKNTGNAGGAKNYGAQFVKTELIGFVDADSYPDTHAISSMVGFFDDETVGAVTTRILVKHRNNFLRKMQAIEYKVIAFTRKLLEFLDAVYVTPGPLVLYRKKTFDEIGRFDSKNMTEDIEATWHLIHDGYRIRMSFAAKSTTVAPDTLKKWLKQRIRWNIGGYQTILKYKHCIFRKGMLGFFILPFFTISLILGTFGLGFLLYRLLRRFWFTYLSAKFSIGAETAIIAANEINLNPSVLNFLGVVLFTLGMFFIFFALRTINRHIHEKENFFSVIFYSLVYALLRPIVLVISLYKFATGKYSWR
jgi:cellulose synthase/poly-beta-1,6-N-acetylglucosamine synthase-like glycosyltransferase